MIDHLSTYASDYLATRDFYRAVFAPLCVTEQIEMVAEWNADFPTQRMCAFGPAGHFTFWVIETRSAATPRHIAFSAQNRAAVDAFHAAALVQGGQDNGQPGLRPHYHAHYHAHYYGAFALDPDGNNVEAVCHQPE